jgi:predicted nucleotide-binding protein
MVQGKAQTTILLIDDQQESAAEMATLLSSVIVTSEMKPLGELFRFVGMHVNPALRDLVDRAAAVIATEQQVKIVLVDLSFDNDNRPEAVVIGRNLAIALRDKFTSLVVGVYTKHRLRLRQRTLVASDGFPVYLEELRLMLDGSERLQGDDWYEIFAGAIAGREQTLAAAREPAPNLDTCDQERLATQATSVPATEDKLPAPRRKPRLFIGSSVEALPLARAVQENLDYSVLSFVWDQITFAPTHDTLHSLLKQLASIDFALFVLAPSDVADMRGETNLVVRDNVLFELGLFIGRIGRDKTFMLAPRNVPGFHLPTDLLGLETVAYDGAEELNDDNARALVGPACNRVQREIRRIAGV